MRMRTLGLLLALASAGVVYAEVKAGEGRAVQAKVGAPLREAPKPLAKAVSTLPFGTRVIVQEVQDAWARVSTPEGATGWVRTSDLVEAGALTSRAARTGAVASADVSAAGRSFDEPTEQGYRATQADLDAAYRLVDAMEQQSLKLDSPALEAFIRDGDLVSRDGRPGSR